MLWKVCWCDSFVLYFYSKTNGKQISVNIFVMLEEKAILQSLKIDFIMANYKRLWSAFEAAKKIMANWSDEEDDITDMVILPQGSVDAVTDDEEIKQIKVFLMI